MMIRKYIAFVVVFFAGISIVFAQQENNLDITYKIKFLKDTNTTDFFEETARLLIHGDSSLFIAHKKEIIDSIRYFSVDNSKFYGVSKHGSIILKDFKAGKVTLYEEFLLHQGMYFTKENMNDLAWDILPDTATVSGYACQRASVSFGNRLWYAWFTTSIPVSDGPYKFCGLPGLIVNMNDATNTWFFSLVRIKKGDSSKINLSYLPSPKQLEKAKFFETKKYMLKNAVQIKRSSPSAVKLWIPGDVGDAELIKITEENFKKDNNWIERYK